MLDDEDQAYPLAWGEHYAEIVAAGGEYTTTTTAYMPWDATPGQKYLLFVADAGQQHRETDEGNNVVAVPITIVSRDLQVTGLGVNPSALHPGSVVTLTWNEVNAGTGAVANDHITWARVENATTGEVLVDEYVSGEGSLGAGETRARQFTFTLPAPMSGVGELVFTVTADPWNYVAEADEGNNAASVTRTSAPRPLTVRAVINNGSAQRSRITSLTLTFSDVVTLDEGAITVLRQNGSLVGLYLSSSSWTAGPSWW